ncbi:YobI family P-loop NTPase [Vibrio algicola]|uniref:YobI-like P-loop NTPase domain-containing protein n=1 Tax=Vibrio algicola TaxID=2662262 RepID=A0A5Q0TJT7_9VIBR|nr:hypothetical protein [Vibrio algicola]
MVNVTALIKFIKRLFVDLCWKLIQLNSEKPVFNSSKLPDLCPTDNAENCEEYIDRLNELLVNREVVKEVAITAPYSGGKSSFINTYMRLHPYHKYTCISLGAFSDDKPDKPEEGDVADINRVEKSIVQQILYKTDSENTPNSRFRKIIKSHPNYFNAFSSSICFVILGIFIAIMSYIPEYSLKHIFSEFLKDGAISTFSLVLIIYVTSILILSIKDAFKIFPKFNLSKFNPLKGEVAFEQRSNDSVFNIYLEEIIYYFSKTKSDVVFFEDLDRFERSEIFVQLKELNKLINDSADVKQSVRFIYALKDDVFKGASRTKFFDAIIPIIPVTNKSNSFPLLKRLLKDSGFENEFKDVYLRDIAVFVDDMRMLKNIVAEYGIYKPILQKNLPQIELQKLFSFIIYKNIYCDDFAELHSGNGKLASFFNDLKSLKSDFKSSVQDKVHLLEQNIIDSEQEHLQSIKELNVVYLSLAVTNINQLDSIEDNNIQSVTEPETFERLMIKNRVDTKNWNSHWGSAIMFADLVNGIEPPYATRKKNIENKNKSYRAKIELDIKKLKQQLTSIPHLSIKELIQQYDRLSVFEAINDDKLLIHLIEKGYIDEQYHLYISVFYEGNIAKSDMDFVMAVKSNEITESNKSLINCAEILKYFSEDEFRSLSFFNYTMLDYLLVKGDESILINVIEYVLKQQDNNIEVLYEANQELVNAKGFGRLIIDNWSDIWLSIISYENLTIEKRNELLIWLLLAVNSDELNEESSNVIKNYLDENESISNAIPTEKNDVTIIQGLFKYLQIEFQQINDCAKNTDFLKFIVKEELFVISQANLLVALNSLSNKVFSNTFSLSDIYEIDNTDLINLIENNIIAISHLIESGEIGIGNKVQYRNLLNNDQVDAKVKQKIIINEKCKINSLSEIYEETTLWGIFFQNNKIEASWGNVKDFIRSKSFDKSQLASFLNLPSVHFELLKKEADLSDEDERIFVDLLISKDIHLSSFEKLQAVVAGSFNEISLDNIVNDKLNSLILNGNISVTKSNYEELKEIDSELSCLLLEQGFDVFLTEIDLENFTFEEAGISFDFDELRILLNSAKLTVKQKNIIITELQEQLQNASAVILDAVISNLNETPFPKPKISPDLLDSLLRIGSSTEEKVTVYTNQIKNLEQDSQKGLLSLLGNDYHNIVITRSNTNIPDTPYNLNLVKELEKVGLISSFSYTESLLGNKQLKVNAKRKK